MLVNFIITVIWWLALALTKHGPQLFEDDKQKENWMAFNGIALGFATLFPFYSVYIASGSYG